MSLLLPRYLFINDINFPSAPTASSLPDTPAQASDANNDNSAATTVTANPSNVEEGAPPTSQPLSGANGRPSQSGHQYASQLSTSATASPTAGRGTSPSASRPNKVPVIIGVVLGVVVAAIVVWLIWRCIKIKTSAAKEAERQAKEKWRATQNVPTSGHGLGVYRGEFGPQMPQQRCRYSD